MDEIDEDLRDDFKLPDDMINDPTFNETCNKLSKQPDHIALTEDQKGKWQQTPCDVPYVQKVHKTS